MNTPKHQVSFETIIHRYDKQADKTGWTYIIIPAAYAAEINPGNKRSFRVKGMLDKHAFEKISVLPAGGGDFIMALNASTRKKINKSAGAMLSVKIELDERRPKPSREFVASMEDEPVAMAAFNKLPKSHQHYFIHWIDGARTDATKAKRIAHAVNALAVGLRFDEMIRKIKMEKDDLLPGI